MINQKVAMIVCAVALASPAVAQQTLTCSQASSLYDANQLTAAARAAYEETCLALTPGADPSAVVIGAGLGVLVIAGVLGDGSTSTTTTTTN